MTVADYVIAAIGLFLCLAWCGGSFMCSMVGSFVPAPDSETVDLARKGCVSLLAGLAALAWFVGVLWTGAWGWL